jgi:hypothetical protein
MELSKNLSGFKLANQWRHFIWLSGPPDIQLINKLVDGDTPHVVFYSQDDLGDWDGTHIDLMAMCREQSLLVLAYARGAFSSGFSWDRVRPILFSSQRFTRLIERIETGFVIHSGWVAVYSGLGRFKFHRDKSYSGGTHRIIFTMGAYDKVMRFKRKGKSGEVGIIVPNNSFVALSKVGGGIDEDEDGEFYCHAIVGGAMSWTFAVHATAI